jgi:glutamine synthetase
VTPRGVLAFCREKEVRVVDLRFTDVFGQWHHITIPVRQLTEATFENGCRIDACQIALNGSVNRLAIPQPSTAFLDTSAVTTTLVMICTIQDALTREDDLLDPRVIAQRAVDFLASTGIADEARIAPQCEFYWFQSARFAVADAHTSYSIVEVGSSGDAGTSSDQSLRRIDDDVSDIGFQARNQITESLEDIGFPIATHHQANSTGSKCRIDFVATNLVRAADAVMSLKHVARRVAQNQHRSVTFMPKPIASDIGASLNVPLSLWKSDEPVFGGQGYGGLSEIAIMAIGGILHHRKALAAICNSTTNSYRRLSSAAGPLFQAGYSSSSQLAACRIPSHATNPKSKRIEVGFADASANPYIAFAAILMAAIDGIQNKIDPGKPLEKLAAVKAEVNKADSSKAEGTDRCEDGRFPKSLWESLDHLKQDQSFLLEGGVFSTEMLDRWIGHKENAERKALESHATPSEYLHYFNG